MPNTSASSSRANPIKVSLLRPSSLAGASSSNSATPTSSSPKNVLRPASFQVDSSTDASADQPPAGPSSVEPATEDASQASVASSTPASAAGPTSSNPFLLMADKELLDEDEDADDGPTNGSNGAASTSADASNGSAASTSTPLSALQSSNGLAKTAGLFRTASATIPSTTTGPADFVFGQNVHERVTVESIHSSDCTSSSSAGVPSTDASSSDGASAGSLFAIAASSSSAAGGGAADQPVTPSAEATVENVSEAARQYEESRAQKRKYEEVETVTGEENETNVMDVNCKLFAFVASNWEVRGPGNLRVNDNKDRTKSPRVVFRTSGNLRVLLNTKIWPGMVVERPSMRSMRFSAIDTDGQIKIFLVMARPDDISVLVNQLNKRVDYEKSRPPVAKRPAAPVASVCYETSSSSASPTSTASNEEFDPAVVDVQSAEDAAGKEPDSTEAAEHGEADSASQSTDAAVAAKNGEGAAAADATDATSTSAEAEAD